MTTETVSDNKTAELEVSEAHQPAPAADDQKAIPAATEANAEAAQETPEQVEERRKQKEREHNQRRLTRRTTEAAEAKAEAKLLREERDRLRNQLEAQAKTSQETGEPQRGDINPKTGEQYSYEEFLERRTDWRADQRVQAGLKADREARQGTEKQQQAAAGSEKVAKAWAERETSFQAATKDYEAVVQPFADDELQTLSHQARMAIVESDVGPALLYHLAKNPDEAERIAGLSHVRQIAELGKLEAKVSMPAKKTTSAPAPANTTSGGRTASKDPAKMDQGEYEAWRKSHGARLGG